MLDSVYIGLTGLMGFSRGLTVIGNNVANLNTPGFKSSQLQFNDLFYRYQFADENSNGKAKLEFGSGLGTGSTSLLFKQGELRQTGNDLDTAIDGNGFFVLEKDGQTLYSRAGQFEFDANGILVTRDNGAHVQALVGGQLQDINISGIRNTAPRATTTVSFSDNLSSGGTTHDITDLTVFDTAGGSHTLKLKFTNNNAVTPGSWTVEVRDAVTDALLTTGEIRFQGNGSPQAGFNTMAFSYAPNGTTPTVITLNFGDPGTFSGATSFSSGTTSTLKVNSQNGFGVGALTTASFDERGNLVITYSNGQTINHSRLALANFNFLPDLQPFEGNFFLNTTNQPRQLSHPDEGVMGRISSGRIEISNVDLAQQFSELIVSQRGYQASSQVISTANEMIQQLFDIKSKR